MDWESAKVELRKPLHPGAVRKPAPGKYGEYVDMYHVITEANRVFGEDGWSYTVTRLEKVSEGSFEITRNKDTFTQVRVGYLATVRVEVGGVVREGAAVGNGSGKPENVADLHESAVKEAESDALKRALRTFGNTFGLALYDKDKANVGIPFDAPATCERMMAAIAKAGTVEDLRKCWGPIHADLPSLPDEMQDRVTKAKDRRKEVLTGDKGASDAPA